MTAAPLLVVTYAVAWWAVRSRPGRVWQAIRENKQRVEVIGLRPYGYKLLSFVLASFLAALGGVVYVLLIGGALYTYLDHRLVALSNSATVQDLPGVLRVPLSEPLFIVGGLFVVLVLFFPGGIAALATGRRGGALLSSRRREPEDEPGGAVPAATPAESAQEVEG